MDARNITMLPCYHVAMLHIVTKWWQLR